MTTLTPGVSLGPYDIVSVLGAGGMGEVYKARDTRLSRFVAIKVLNAGLAADPEFRERFEREAKSISALNHPNICTLYDVGKGRPKLAGDAAGAAAGREADEIQFIVMEHLEGETLAARLMRGPLPLADALKTAVEIASALDRAHHQGIVHRDLKPGNVMLTKSGAKLLDFGLAKINAAGAVSNSTLTALATSPLPSAHSPALTAQGAILGTFQYMAPEQIEGEEAQPRTDIFAFGAVLYEMITGAKAFTGRSQASLLSAIMKDEPSPVSRLQPLAPPALDRVVATCLAKDPDARWQSAADLTRELRWIADDRSGAKSGVGRADAAAAAAVAPRQPWGARLPWIVAAVCALFAIGFGVVAFLPKASPDVRVQKLSLLPPAGARWGGRAISPDGRMLAFSATVEGRTQLWVRKLAEESAQPLNGTDGASLPFWSPDSRRIGFFAMRKLKKIQVSGGPPQTLCNAPLGLGGTWNSDNVIVFAPDQLGVLYRVSSEDGSAPSPVTAFDKATEETQHRFPSFLPDGHHFLYVAIAAGGSQIKIGSLEEPVGKRLVDGVDNIKPFVAAGLGADGKESSYLLFRRDGTLLALPFDQARSAATAGDAIQIAADVAGFSVSANGTLEFQTTSPDGELVWFDRQRKRLESVGARGRYNDIELSPDNKRLAVARIDPQRQLSDIWLFDLPGVTPTQFTFGQKSSLYPRWSPDAQQIMFWNCAGDRCGIYRKASDSAGAEQIILAADGGAQLIPSDWHRADPGRDVIVFRQLPRGSEGSLWTLPLQGDQKAVMVPETEVRGVNGRVSPDGRWLAYTTDESGQTEVWVRPFQGPGDKQKVSRDGGNRPSWGKETRELFYLKEGKLMAVPVETARAFRVTGAAQPIADVPFDPGSYGKYPYAVDRDGQRVLVITPMEDGATAPLTVVLNWAAGLKK